MSKESVLQKIEEDLGHSPALRAQCRALVDFFSKYPPQDLEQITFGLIGRAASVDTLEAIPIAQYFSGSLNHLLDRKFMFSYEGEDFEVDDSAIASARLSKVFFHPDTGEAVPNYENFIFIYFSLSEKGLEIAGGNHGD